jgi:hypothetical protein
VYNLSVVNIVPDAQRVAVNKIAELFGCGENNIGVKLQKADGSIYWGCHSWWIPEDYATFSNPDVRAQVVPADLLPSLAFLYERTSYSDSPQDNWQAALLELGLSLFESGV